MTIWSGRGSRSLLFVCGLLSLVAALGIGCNSSEPASEVSGYSTATNPRLVRQSKGPELLQLQHGTPPNTGLCELSNCQGWW
jgi:hypothetical protein